VGNGDSCNRFSEKAVSYRIESPALYQWSQSKLQRVDHFPTGGTSERLKGFDSGFPTAISNLVTTL